MALRTILLVDDDPVLLRSNERTLLRNRRVVHTATNQHAALELARHETIDLAIIDWRLGADDGIALIRELKIMQPGVVLVLVSALASIDVAVEAAHAGATRVAAKPFCARTLVQMVEAPAPRPIPTWIPSLDQVQREHILRAVRECDGNVARAAELLGISRTTVYGSLGPSSPRPKRRTG